MDIPTASRAAALLHRHWMDGTRLENLPDALRPRTRSAGYAVQAQLAPHNGSPLFGWKIAATSAAGQRHIGVDGPMAGRIFSNRVIDPNRPCPLEGNAMRLAELEFAFRMREPLPPRRRAYTVAEVMAAVDTLHLAIELPDSRYETAEAAGEAQLIADNACAHLFLLGPAAAEGWQEQDLAATGVVAVLDQDEPVHGQGRNVLGEPRLALQWLVNELCSLDLTLAAGQIVTTGTCVTPIPVRPGSRLAAEFGGLGTIALDFA